MTRHDTKDILPVDDPREAALCQIWRAIDDKRSRDGVRGLTHAEHVVSEVYVGNVWFQSSGFGEIWEYGLYGPDDALPAALAAIGCERSAAVARDALAAMRAPAKLTDQERAEHPDAAYYAKDYEIAGFSDALKAANEDVLGKLVEFVNANRPAILSGELPEVAAA